MGKIFKNAKSKHGLNSKIGFKTKFGLNLGEKNHGGKRKRKRKKREEPKRYGYMTFVWILVRFGMDLWISCMEF